MKNDWLWLLVGVGVLYYLSQQQGSATATGGGLLAAITPTPYSIYPEYSYMGYTSATPTSMASSGTQQATTAVQPTSLYTFTQSQEAAALEAQCAGSYPGCTPTLGDTQLGM